ncbi:MAG TPA: hypothetical protein VFQ53_41585 [Kofleriaceae bacterium]|nr:hypothetical protein [Kofleriaceae bacterium]
MTDEDLRAVLAAAHEPAPSIDRVLAARAPRRWLRPVVVMTAAAAVTIAALVIAWPRHAPRPAAPVLDLSAAELRSTTIVTPLDSLLEVPGLAPLQTLPELGRVPTVELPGGSP